MVATHKQMMEHIAPETSRDDLHCVISDLYDQLTEYRIKHEVACSTLELVKERMDASQRALAAQCKQTKELERQRDELLAELLRVKEICLREVGIGIVNEVVIAAARKEKK